MHGDRFVNRDEGGILLGREVRRRLGSPPEPIVLALPRGGVPVGFRVAEELNAELEVFVVRKLGVPGYEELAMGAIASGGVRVLNREVLARISVSAQAIDAVVQRETKELERRERAYRGQRPPLNVEKRTAIVVDDGLATGSTMRAAVNALRQMRPLSIVVAVPVAAPETCAEFRREVEEIVCLRTPSHFRAVGLWYDDFEQTTDEEVHRLLERASARTRGAA